MGQESDGFLSLHVWNRLMQQVSGALREVADAKVDMRRDVDRVCDKLQSKVDLVGQQTPRAMSRNAQSCPYGIAIN